MIFGHFFFILCFRLFLFPSFFFIVILSFFLFFSSFFVVNVLSAKRGPETFAECLIFHIWILFLVVVCFPLPEPLVSLVVGLSFLLVLVLCVLLLGSLVLALSLSLFFAMVTILGGAVSLIGFWVVLGTNQFGRSRTSEVRTLSLYVVGSSIVVSSVIGIMLCVLLLGSLALGLGVVIVFVCRSLLGDAAFPVFGCLPPFGWHSFHPPSPLGKCCFGCLLSPLWWCLSLLLLLCGVFVPLSRCCVAVFPSSFCCAVLSSSSSLRPCCRFFF